MARDDQLGEGNLPPCALALEEKQRRFCEEYLIDLDGTNAYDRSGYTPGTAASARTASCRLLGKPNIQEYIAYLKEKRNERTRITQDRVLMHVASIAFSDITDYVRWVEGRISYQDSDQLAEGTSLAISEFSESVSPEGRRSKSMKLYNKMDALKLLGKHTGLFQGDLNAALATVRKYGYELVDTYVTKDVDGLDT